MDNPANEPSGTAREYFTLTDFVAYLWKRRTILILLNILGVIVTAVVIWFATPSYTATMVVVPAANATQGAGGGLLSSLAGQVAGGMGLGIGANLPDTFSSFVQLYRSPAVVSLLDRKYHLRQVLFSSRWDSKAHKWIESPQTLKDYLSLGLHSLLGKPISFEPSYSSTSRWLTQKISITLDPDTQLWTIQMDSPDPDQARWLLQTLYNATEGYIREQQKAQTLSQVAYLNRRLSQITVEDYRQTLLDILATQEKSLMLLDSTAPVAAQIEVPLTVSDEATSPAIGLDLAIGILASIIFSVVLVGGSDWYLSARQTIRATPTPDAERAVNAWFQNQGGRLRGYVSGKQNHKPHADRFTG